MNDGLPRRVEAGDLAVASDGLVKRYGAVEALKGVDLTVPEGSFFLLVGPNGAGKSTLLRILLDTVRADAGSARVLGMDTRRGAEVRALIGWVPEDRGAHYGWMPMRRLVAHHAAYYPSWDQEYAAFLIDALGVKMDRKFGQLSKGEAARAQLLLALALRPRVLLLDEPTDGLDPAGRETVLGLLAEHLSEAPATVVASTHRVYEMDRLADHVGVLRDGAFAAQLSRPELHRRLRSYLLQLGSDAGPPGAPDDLDGGGPPPGVTVVRRSGQGRERHWMIWGNEGDVTAWLVRLGVTVRDVESVSLEDAAVAVLSAEVRN